MADTNTQMPNDLQAVGGQSASPSQIPNDAQEVGSGAFKTPNMSVQPQEGLLSRTYETSIKPAVNLAADEVKYQYSNNPTKMFHDAVDAFKSGDWKTGSRLALQSARMIPDKDDPLVKAAEQLVMQPVEHLKAAAKEYQTNRAAGKGVVQSAFSSPNGGESSPDVHAIQAVPILGSVAGQLGTLMSTDIHDKNWRALAGDVLGPMLTFGAGEALEILNASKAATAAKAADIEGNLIRPGIKTVAGVDVPVSTSSLGEGQSLASKVVQKGATPMGAQKFINEYTQPAAERANVANIGEGVNKSVNEMQTVRGETPAPVTIQSLDDSVTALQKAAKPTYKILDDAAQPEISAWERAQEKWDIDNPKPEKPTADLLTPTTTKQSPITATERQLYKQKLQDWTEDKADWEASNPKPKTFTELQDQITQAKRTLDSKFSSQVDKEAAKKGLPQYQQELKDYTTRHGNVVNPDELRTADKLWAQSKQMEWLSDKVRTATTGTTGTSSVLKQQPINLSEESLKRIPSAFDNKFGAGSWERTLGPQGVANYNEILNAIRNPIAGTIPFRVFVRDHLGAALSIYSHIPIIGKLPDNLLFNPTFGQTALDLWKATAKKAGTVVKIAAPTAFAAQPPSNQAKRTVYAGASGLGQ
jgi:hypothetical protein